MNPDYSSMPEDTKVWVFPSQKKIYPNEIEKLEIKIEGFITSFIVP